MEIPIQTVHLFPKLDSKLIELLQSLDPSDWSRYTLAKKWTVKDVATHLLDGNIRMLSAVRDNYFGDSPDHHVESYTDLVAYLNQLNSDWVRATKRMSPTVLIELLEITGNEYCEVVSRLDPLADAIFSVAWAGQSVSPNWFHIAREYTEKWHHQQQIREAVNKPGILTREFFFPLIDTFMQALPYAYRTVEATEGTKVRLVINGEMGGEWILSRSNSNWHVKTNSATSNFEAEISMDPDIAWKLCTNAIPENDAESQIDFNGDLVLAKQVLQMRSVMV
jgi:uncharacterized protein (TIGR03083 family)